MIGVTFSELVTYHRFKKNVYVKIQHSTYFLIGCWVSKKWNEKFSVEFWTVLVWSYFAKLDSVSNQFVWLIGSVFTCFNMVFTFSAYSQGWIFVNELPTVGYLWFHWRDSNYLIHITRFVSKFESKKLVIICNFYARIVSLVHTTRWKHFN